MPATIIGGGVDKVLFPTMSKIQDDSVRLRQMYRRTISAIALLTLPSSVLLFILAPEIILLFLGPNWLEAIAPFQILVVSLLFRTSYKMSDTLVRATGAVYRSALRQTVYFVMIVGATWFGHHWGLAGAAAGVTVAIAINFLLMAFLSMNLINMPIRQFMKAHLPAIAISLPITFVSFIVYQWLLIIDTLVIIRIIIPLLAASITAVLLVRMSTKIFLGVDGLWKLRILNSRLPTRISGTFGKVLKL